MSIRMLPVDEATRVVNALEISVMEKNESTGQFTITQSGGTVSYVSEGHAAYGDWKKIYEAGWAYMANAPVPEGTNTVSDVTSE